MDTYRTITGVYGYRYGIYERGAATVQVRRDGRRFRAQWDAVRWVGNTGGHHTYTVYLSRIDGRAMVRACRRAQKFAVTAVGRAAGASAMDVLTIISGAG